MNTVTITVSTLIIGIILGIVAIKLIPFLVDIALILVSVAIVGVGYIAGKVIDLIKWINTLR